MWSHHLKPTILFRLVLMAFKWAWELGPFAPRKKLVQLAVGKPAQFIMFPSARESLESLLSLTAVLIRLAMSPKHFA
jgi:hypothetical protein